MPRRRWRRRLRIAGGGKCPRSVSGFLEPCLLLLLHQRPAHGYELLDGLREFGFDKLEVDPSTVYRALRWMENHGLVESRWDLGERGPPRRVYRITPEGDLALASWVEDLRETRKMLGDFIQAYEEHLEREHSAES